MAQSNIVECVNCHKRTTQEEADDRNFNTGFCANCGYGLEPVAQSNGDELRILIEEKLSEYSIHPQETHVEDCGYWGTEDGDGIEFCNCSYKFDVDQFTRCMPEIMQLILADRKQHELDARIDEVRRQPGITDGNGWGSEWQDYRDERLSTLKAEREAL